MEGLGEEDIHGKDVTFISEPQVKKDELLIALREEMRRTRGFRAERLLPPNRRVEVKGRQG
jgi:hypothetical protein